MTISHTRLCLPSVSALHFSHSLVCWWLFGSGRGVGAGHKAEDLITVLAREQKKLRGRRDGEGEKMVEPRAFSKSSCGVGGVKALCAL